ncbi:MAG: EamA family transporter [Frankiaceae bacterium]
MTALLALASSLLWGTADFLGGTATRRLPAYAVIGGSQALAVLMLLPVAVPTGSLGASLGYLPWALASGIVGLIALAAFYSALATGTMGVVAPIAATSVVVPVAVGVASGDTPSIAQLAGIVAAVGGVVLASGPARGSRRERAAMRPLLLAVVAAAGFGAVTVFLAMGAKSSVVMTLVTMRVETVAILLCLALLTRRTGGISRGDLPLLAAIGFGDVTANATYSLATLAGDLSIVAVLGSLYPAVTVLLAREIHGERFRRIQGFGVSVALAGVVLIAAGGGTG